MKMQNVKSKYQNFGMRSAHDRIDKIVPLAGTPHFCTLIFYF